METGGKCHVIATYFQELNAVYNKKPRLRIVGAINWPVEIPRICHVFRFLPVER